MNDDDADGRHVLCQAKNHRENSDRPKNSIAHAPRTVNLSNSSERHTSTGRSSDGKREGRSSVLFGRPSGPLRSATSALANERYFCATALVATPPPADCTQTVVGEKAIVLRNAQAPALTGVVAMRVPVQAPPTAGPLWIATLAAKVPLASAVVVPSTRS